MNTEKSKTVAITGVSSGLGFGLAQAYLASGWTVYGLSRREPESFAGQAGLYFQAVDLAELNAIDTGLTALLADLKELDLLILNAGILGEFGDMTSVSLDTMKHVLEVNLWANKVILDYFHHKPIPIKQVVAISSGASTSGARGWNGYGLSKAALNMLIKLYAREWPQTHLCALAPGLIDSAMQDHLASLDAGDQYPTLQRIQECRNTPVMPSPDAAAKMVMTAIERLPAIVASGDYADVRKL